MQWLEKIRPPKFLRNIFYRIYKHDEHTQNVSTPITTAIFVLGFTHFFQLFFLILLIGYLFDINTWGAIFTRFGKFVFIVCLGIFFLLVLLFYTFKNKHLNYIIEFENETKSEKKRGFIYLFIYLFISILMLSLGYWLITFNNPNYDHYKTDTQQIEYQEEDASPFELK